jgi:hypothetical protein
MAFHILLRSLDFFLIDDKKLGQGFKQSKGSDFLRLSYNGLNSDLKKNISTSWEKEVRPRSRGKKLNFLRSGYDWIYINL